MTNLVLIQTKRDAPPAVRCIQMTRYTGRQQDPMVVQMDTAGCDPVMVRRLIEEFRVGTAPLHEPPPAAVPYANDGMLGPVA